MATAEGIAAFRLLIDEHDDKLPYTDAVLGERLDGSGSPYALAAEIWREKAASYAGLVNVSESGSSRNLGDLQRQALAMAAELTGSDPNASTTSVRGTRMSRLTR